MRLRSDIDRPRLVLPPELLEYTIDYLHDSPSALRACVRVCRDWVAPSRFHLFYYREITPTREMPVPLQICKLLQFLQGSPHIARYIREFHFSVQYYSILWMPDSDWPQVDAALPQLLGMLTQLRKLVLSGIPFTALVPDTRAAFRALFALPCLVDVEVILLKVAKLDHFTTLLRSPLKRLSMSQPFPEEQFTFNPEEIRAIDEEIKAVELQERSPCRLEYLYSDHSVFMHWLLGPQTTIDISTIRTLDAWCGTEHMEGLMARLIRRLGPSLEDLTIQLHNIEDWDGSPTKDTIDLECNPNIRRLDVLAEFDHPLASYLKYLLSRLSAPNIQQITFHLLWSPEPMNWEGWNEVDQVLDGVNFRGLREVAIEMAADNNQEMEIAYQHAIDQFPSMWDRGILDVRRA